MNENQDDASPVYVTLTGMEVNIQDEIPKIRFEEDFKDSLLANLYSTVEFLKKELEEKNFIIKALLARENVVCLCSKNHSKFETRSEIETSCSDKCDDISNSTTLSNSHESNLNSTITDNCFESKNNSVDSNDSLNNKQLIDESSKEETNVKLTYQLNELRKGKHSEYIKLSNNDVNVNENCENNLDNNNHKWPKKTLLCISDSMLNQLDERILSKKGLNTKVRAFSGSNIKNMYNYMIPLLQKEPEYILLHVGTADAPFKSSEQILTELLQLKTHIETMLPGVIVIISQPIMRTDNMKANLTIQQLARKLDNLKIRILDNSNIGDVHLGRKGLHLNGRGTGRLALNIMSLIKQL